MFPRLFAIFWCLGLWAGDASDFRKAMFESFDPYTVEKAGRLLEQRYSPNLSAAGFVLYLHLARHDVHCGRDGFTGEKLQASQVGIFSLQVVSFASMLRGPAFAQEVAIVLGKTSFDEDNFRTTCSPYYQEI
jgi:hypothetical protein